MTLRLCSFTPVVTFSTLCCACAFHTVAVGPKDEERLWQTNRSRLNPRLRPVQQWHYRATGRLGPSFTDKAVGFFPLYHHHHHLRCLQAPPHGVLPQGDTRFRWGSRSSRISRCAWELTTPNGPSQRKISIRFDVRMSRSHPRLASIPLLTRGTCGYCR